LSEKSSEKIPSTKFPGKFYRKLSEKSTGKICEKCTETLPLEDQKSRKNRRFSEKNPRIFRQITENAQAKSKVSSSPKYRTRSNSSKTENSSPNEAPKTSEKTPRSFRKSSTKNYEGKSPKISDGIHSHSPRISKYIKRDEKNYVYRKKTKSPTPQSDAKVKRNNRNFIHMTLSDSVVILDNTMSYEIPTDYGNSQNDLDILINAHVSHVEISSQINSENRRFSSVLSSKRTSGNTVPLVSTEKICTQTTALPSENNSPKML